MLRSKFVNVRANCPRNKNGDVVRTTVQIKTAK